MSKGAVDFSHVEISCQKPISGSSFAQGMQQFIFSYGRPSAWIPSQSYFLMDVTVEGANANQPPLVSEALALVEDCGNAAYQSVYFISGGCVVDQVTNFVQQTSAVKHRIRKPESWFKALGAGAAAYNGSFTRRCEAISQFGSSPDPDNYIIYRASPSATTVAIADNTGIVSYVGTAPDFLVGDILVITGVQYPLADQTHAETKSLNAVIATADWYILRRKALRTYKAKNRQQVIFQPPLGIFQSSEILPGGSFEFQLTPSASYKTLMIESTKNVTATDDGVANSADHYKVTINNLRFYAAMCKESIPDTTKQLFLMEYFVQSKQLTTGSMNLQFSVPPTTNALMVFAQSTAAGTGGANSMYPVTRFVSSSTTNVDFDLTLQNIQISYANKSLPMNPWQSNFSEGTSAGPPSVVAYPIIGSTCDDRLIQWYYQGFIDTSQLNREGGVEDLQLWLNRGPIFKFSFDRDSQDRSTEVNLIISYSGGANAYDASATPTNIFLVAQYIKPVELTFAGGMVTNVRVA